MTKTIDLLHGKIMRSLCILAVPIVMTYFIQMAYNFIDMIWIGRLGSGAVAGVGVAGMFTWFSNGLVMMAKMGGQVKIGHCLGAGDDDDARRYLGAALKLGIVFALFFGIGINILAHSLIGFFHLSSPAVIHDAVLYLRITCGLVIFTFMNQIFTSSFNVYGDSRTPFIMNTCGLVSNVIADPLLIFGIGPFPALGVAGAAVATVIAQGVSVVLCILYVMARVRILIPGRKHLDVGRKLYWDLFSQSISMGLMSSIVSAGSVILQYGINGLGTLTIAGHTAARKLFAFTDMPLIAMANAASTFVSQNYGAGQPERIRKGMREIYLYSLVVMVVTVLLMQVSAEWLVRMVSGSSEALVLENGARYLRWTSPFYAVLGVLLSTRYALQSLGEKVLPLFSSVIEFLGKIVFVLVFIPRFAYDAVILCEPVIWCFMALYLVAVYRCNPFVFPKKKQA